MSLAGLPAGPVLTVTVIRFEPLSLCLPHWYRTETQEHCAFQLNALTTEALGLMKTDKHLVYFPASDMLFSLLSGEAHGLASRGTRVVLGPLIS